MLELVTSAAFVIRTGYAPELGVDYLGTGTCIRMCRISGRL